jgi:hypothetical protein
MNGGNTDLSACQTPGFDHIPKIFDRKTQYIKSRPDIPDRGRRKNFYLLHGAHLPKERTSPQSKIYLPQT